MYDINYKEISAHFALLKLNENHASRREIFLAEKELQEIVAERERIERIQNFENAVVQKAIMHFRNVSNLRDVLYNATVATASSGMVRLNPDMIIYNPDDFVLESEEWITKMNQKLKASEGIYLTIDDVHYDKENDCYHIVFYLCTP